MSRLLAALSVACLTTAGCIEPFQGSDMELVLFNMGPSEGVTQANLTPAATHYSIWVTQNAVVVPVANFKIVPIVDPTDPCSIDYFGEQAGMGIVEAAMDREAKAKAAGNRTAELAAIDQRGRISRLNSGVKGIVSYVPGDPKPAAAIATMPAAERLAACNAFIKANPNYYVSSFRVLTAPQGGFLLGIVDGNDPDSGGFLGGSTFVVDYNLGAAVEIFITLENDDNPDTRGPVILSGQLTSRNRGARYATMTGALIRSGSVPRAEVSIYSEFDQDEVNF